MMRALLPVLWMFASLVQAQPNLVHIEYQGCNKTHPSYFPNFVMSKVGEPVDTLQLAQDVKNLWNTNLYADVYYELFDTLGGTAARFVLREKWTSYPAGNGGIIDENFWMELGWRDNHLLGRGIRAMLLAKYYDRFAVRGFFQAPYWFGKGFGMESNWEIGRTIEPLGNLSDEVLDFNQDRVFVNMLASFALKPSNLLYFGVEYHRLAYMLRYDEELLAPDAFSEVQTQYLLVARHHTRYHLNIFEQYVTGWSNEVLLKTAFVPDPASQRLYPFFQNETKLFFRPWKSGNVGTRLRAGIAENDASVFAQFIQDSFLNVRGIGNKPYRGTAELTWNVELRQTIYDRRWVALQSVAFFDYSAIRPPAGDFNSMFTAQHSHAYAGLGGRIFFKNVFDFIMRLDVGLSLQDGSGGFVMGLGQYF